MWNLIVEIRTIDLLTYKNVLPKYEKKSVFLILHLCQWRTLTIEGCIRLQKRLPNMHVMTVINLGKYCYKQVQSEKRPIANGILFAELQIGYHL